MILKAEPQRKLLKELNDILGFIIGEYTRYAMHIVRYI